MTQKQQKPQQPRKNDRFVGREGDIQIDGYAAKDGRVYPTKEAAQEADRQAAAKKK